MKHLLFLQKRVAMTSLFIGLLLTATSFTFGPVDDAKLLDNVPQKKVQRVKVMVNKDGKETTIDTTFNLPDEKAIQHKIDSMLSKMDIKGMGLDKSNIVIHRKGNGVQFNSKDGKNLRGDQQFDITILGGDSGKTKLERKIIRIGKDGGVYSLTGPGGDHMVPPPPPPVPGHARVIYHQRFGGDPFAFDAKDESVVSYDKKDIGKGLEKITIIRKKKTESTEFKQVEVRVETSDETKK